MASNILSALFGGNPFQKAQGDDPWAGMREVTPPADMQPMPAQAAPTSRQSAMSGYSPLRDPNGPLARAGWIGSLLATGDTREQAMMKDAGSGQQAAVTGIGRRLQEGMAPQRAIFDFAQSPEGQDFFTSGGGFSDLANVVKGLSPDPVAAARGAAFGDQGGVSVAKGSDTTSATGSDQGPERFIKAAQRLAQAGDTEGANLAMKMAEEARQLEQMKKPPTSADLNEYDRYVAQEKEAGREPMPWFDYASKMAQAKSPKSTTNVNTAGSIEAQKFGTRLKVDEDAAKEAGAVALKAQQSLPALSEIERLSDKVAGGYKGSLRPMLAKVASTFGMDIPEEWSDAETLNALSMQLLPLVRQPGAVSDYEQKAYMSAIPALGQSQEGRMKMVKVIRKQAERSQQIAEVYRDNIGEKDLYKKLAALDKPMFTPEETAEFEALGKGEVPATQKSNIKEAPPAKVAGPQIGTVETGDDGNPYEFTGGDAANPKSWKLKPAQSGGGY